MKFKKLISTTLAIFLAVTSLTGCTSSSNEGGENTSQVKLTFQMNFPSEEKITQVYQEISEEFEKENPNIDVEIIPGTSDYEAVMKTKMAANELPDLFATHGWSVERYSEYLRPLNDQEWFDEISPQIKPMITNEKDEVFVLPTDIDLAGMVYNIEVLEKSGVNVDDIKTWNDFYEACDKVKSAGFTPAHVGGKDNWTLGNIFDWVAPSVLITDENNYYGDKLQDGSFDWAKWEDVANILTIMNDKDYFNKDKVSSTFQDSAKALAQNQVAFCFLSNNVAVEAWKYNPEAKIGFMPIPSFYEGDESSLIAGERSAVGIWKDSENEEEALQYLAYLAKPENIEKLASANGLPSGLTTSTSDTGKLKDFYEKYKNVETFPFFDRVYLPSGMWDTLCSTASGILTKEINNKKASEQVKADYERLKK